MATTVQTDEGRSLLDDPDVDADRATTRTGQGRPDYADHNDVRARGHRVKGGDLDVLLATDDADELCLRCIGSVIVERARSPYSYLVSIGNGHMIICLYVWIYISIKNESNQKKEERKTKQLHNIDKKLS